MASDERELITYVKDYDGIEFTSGAGLFALSALRCSLVKRSLGREIEFGEVFQCVGVWVERGIGYVALSQRSFSKRRGIPSVWFRKIG